MITLNDSTSLVRALWEETDGQDLIEYSLLLAFLALAAVSILSEVKSSVNSILSKTSSALATGAAAAS